MYRNSDDTYFCINQLEQRSLLRALWVSVTSTISFWWVTRELSAEIKVERKELADLPDHILHDIGVSRAEASAESRRIDLPVDRVRGLRVLK